MGKGDHLFFRLVLGRLPDPGHDRPGEALRQRGLLPVQGVVDGDQIVKILLAHGAGGQMRRRLRPLLPGQLPVQEGADERLVFFTAFHSRPLPSVLVSVSLDGR